MVSADFLPGAGQRRYWRLRKKGCIYELQLREQGVWLHWTVHRVQFDCADQYLREVAETVAQNMLESPKALIGDWK